MEQTCSHVAMKVNSCVWREVFVFICKHFIYDYYSIAVDEYHYVAVHTAWNAWIRENVLLKVKETLAVLELNCQKEREKKKLTSALTAGGINMYSYCSGSNVRVSMKKSSSDNCTVSDSNVQPEAPCCCKLSHWGLRETLKSANSEGELHSKQKL